MKKSTINFNIITTFCTISAHLEKKGNNHENILSQQVSDAMKTCYADIDNEIQQLSGYLGTTYTQTIIFAALYSKQLLRDGAVDLDDLTNFLGMTGIEFLPFRTELDALHKLKLIEKSDSRRRVQYRVTPDLETAMQYNEPYKAKKASKLDSYQFCSRVSDLIEERSDEDLTTDKLFSEVEKLEKLCSELPIVDAAMKLKLRTADRTLLYEICDDYVRSRTDLTNVNITLRDIYERTSDALRVGKKIMSEQHPLQTDGLAELCSANFFSEAEITLTEKAQHIFLGDDFELFMQKKSKSKALLAPEDIKEKKLFFDPELTKRLDFLKNSMQEDQLKALQKRLEDNALPKGLTVLFYGGAGTGKTESVMQLAKATGRSVFHVDISACKSKWFGDSEKIMKSIFTTYREMCKKEPIKPILLFNEADALFSKRKDSDSSNVAQTENAIQNILLEEMESLDGILMATTNLVKNFDGAFARRFLFKIPFGQPTQEAKCAIWQNKLEWLSEKDANTLARNYDLSGGEIDNVVRKALMEEVLNGKRPDMATISEWCRDEKVDQSKGGKIGFAV